MGKVSMPQGKGSQLHNRRDYEKIGRAIPDNIDISKSSENITLVDKDLRQAYREIFGKALEQYNDKQKRSDRRIEDYCNHIQKSKNGEKLFYEDVVQWGSKEDFAKNPDLREKAKEALVKYVESFEDRNSNLKLIGAYIHMDEASPHLHLDYVPVAHGYSRGLEIRNSLDKAMKQMGFQPEKESRKNNATKLWKENERAVFGEICRGLGLEVEQERKSDRKSLTVEEYKDARDEMLGEIEQQRDDLQEEYDGLKQDHAYLQKKYEDLKQEHAELQEDIDIAKDVVEKYQELAAVYKQETAEASNLAVEAKGDLEDLQEQKKALEGQISALETKKAEGEKVLSLLKTDLREKMDRYQDEKEELQRTLPVLRKEVKEAKEELKIVQKAVDQKMDQGQQLFSMLTLQQRLDEARKEIEKEKKMSRLEVMVEKFERFIQTVPGVRELWNKFVEKERAQEQKKSRSGWER